jgi:hypothetical protein
MAQAPSSKQVARVCRSWRVAEGERRPEVAWVGVADRVAGAPGPKLADLEVLQAVKVVPKRSISHL